MTAARRPGPGIAAWAALPERDRALLLWLVHGDVVTAELAGLLAYGHRRIAQRRLARLVEYGLLTGSWAANRQRPRGRYVLRKGERSAAAWRDAPPVDDELWARVQSLLAARTRGGGRRRTDEPDPLRGLLRCACGSTIRSAGFMGGKRRRLHSTQPCPEGVVKKIWDTETWLAPLEAQVGGLRVDDATASAIVAALATPEAAPVPVDAARVERRRRELAIDMAAGRTSERAFLAALRRLDEEEARAGDARRPATTVGAAAAVDYIRNFAASWAKARPATRAALIQSVYAEVVVRGDRFVSVRLTPDAYAHRLDLALPQEVTVPALPTRGGAHRGPNMALARPTGFEPATFGSGGRRSIR